MTTTNDDLKVVSYDKTGRVRVDVDGELHTLRRPTFGEFKLIKRQLTDTKDDIHKISDAAESGEMPSDELLDKVLEQRAEVISKAFTLLSDKPLPESMDDWPTWLVMSDDLLANLMNHWRSVPLARG